MEKVGKQFVLAIPKTTGEVISDITEMTHYDPDPNALPVGNGSYLVKMLLKRQIPNFIPPAVYFISKY